MRDNEKKVARITGIAMVIVMAVVIVAGALVPDKEHSSAENRLLQMRPSFRAAEYLDGRFEASLENYLNDQFPGRNTFIKVKTSADSAIGILENNGVYRAKDHYLIEDIVTPDENELVDMGNAIAEFKVENENIQMYFLLAPNAGNILSNKLPKTVSLADQNRYMEELFDSLTEADVTPIDIRERFLSERSNVQLYYRTDHHWTTDGAYVAYQEAVQAMTEEEPLEYEPLVVKNDFEGTLYSKSGFTNGLDDEIHIYYPVDTVNYKQSVIYYSDTQEKTTEFYQLDNLDTKDAYTVFGGSNHPMYTIKTPAKSKRRLLLIKDSYANSMIPFLAQHFREIVVVDPRYYFDDLQDLVDSEDISDVLFLYNANTLFADDSLMMMLGD